MPEQGVERESTAPGNRLPPLSHGSSKCTRTNTPQGPALVMAVPWQVQCSQNLSVCRCCAHGELSNLTGGILGV